MRLRFTKMHGAGNDFVVLDATREPLALTPAQLRHLADRRFGVGADQILVVERPTVDGVDFRYRIFNGSGQEVEHCGNGARCFLVYVRAHGLSDRDTVTVQTVNNRLVLQRQPDGRVTVDMNRPRFDAASLPLDPSGLVPRREGSIDFWPVEIPGASPLEVATLSMGNPHAVCRVADVATAAVTTLGPLVERHRRFPRAVNVGFLQVISRGEVALRVWERDAGETLACGTGACAAVVAGIRAGWLDAAVEVHTRGGDLRIEWAGGDDDAVFMTGPATLVFEGEIEL